MAIAASGEQIVPEPVQIIGTVMRPFCLGHHLLFKRLGLPFVESPLAEAGRDDIIIGIIICGASYEWTLAQMLSGDWAKAVAEWKRNVRGPWWNRRRVDWNKAETLFRAYLSDGYKQPPLWRHRITCGVSLSAPWEQMLRCTLVSNGFTESEAMNGYLPGRWYDYYTLSEFRQLETCDSPKKWRKVFYTQEDESRMQAIRQ